MRSIPNYELYGELLSGSYTDPVHYETIQERSRQHNWTIRLHRHTRLAQVFIFRSPGVSVQLADVVHSSTEPVILFVPPGVPHGFAFPQDVNGDVLSLCIPDLDDDVVALLKRPEMKSGGILLHSRTTSFEHVDTLFSQLRQVYHGIRADRSELLRDITKLIVRYVSGDIRNDRSVANVIEAPHMTRHEIQASSFCTLVEERFADGWAVADYAAAIGVSAPTLTRLCRLILGSSPNNLVRQRRLLEAKRLLEHTRLTISEIAHRSGFRDPSFFCRSFSASFGMPPIAYRRATER